jgi:tight adherence protein B
MSLMEPTTIALIVAGLTGIVVLLLMHSVADAGASKRVRKRIERIQSRTSQSTQDGTVAGMPSLKLEKGHPSLANLDALVKRFMPRPELLRQRLRRSGRTTSLGGYALWCLGVGAIASIGRAFFLDIPPLLAVLFGVATGLGLPHLFVGFLIRRRIKIFVERFPEAIDLIVRGLKSGLPVTESIRNVGEEFNGAVGEEFRLVSDRVKLGQPIDDALNETANRIDLPDFRFFVIALSVQRETGGNLASALENLSDILRRRRQMKLKIKALSSEAKASAIIIGSLPFIMFLILRIVSGDYVQTLFTDPRGMMLVAIGLGFMVVGIGVMMKMVRFEI